MSRTPKKADPAEAQLTVALRGDLASRLRTYMAENGHPNPPTALREILSIYFASTPMDGAVLAARDAAMNNTKHWIFTRLSILFIELQAELDQQVSTIEKSGFGK